MTTGEGFARPELLVDAAWVAEHLDDPNVVVLDGDVEAGYLRGHIPGAVMVPDNYAKDPDTGRVHILAPEKFATFCQNLGIGDDTLVITYDNNQSLYSGRLWWCPQLLRAYQRQGPGRWVAHLGQRGPPREL